VTLQDERYILGWDYPGPDGDLSQRKGDIITVIEKYQDGWWLAKSPCGTRTGLIPSTFLLTYPDLELVVLQPDNTKSEVPFANIRGHVIQNNDAVEAHDLTGRRRSRGEIFADSAHFYNTNDTIPGVSGAFYPREEQRNDFVNNINTGAELV